MIEIERKFLPSSTFALSEIKKIATKTHTIQQGYLSSVPERTVRVRAKNDLADLTIKGIGSATGASRLEWEKQIDILDARQLLDICESGIIHKTRYEVPIGNHVYEIDVFEASLIGLIIIEIELENEADLFLKPHWVGTEVTGVERYYNSYISLNGFGS